MSRWRIVAGPRGYAPRSSSSSVGWSWEIERNDTTMTVEVELTALASSRAATGPLRDVDAERARRSCGRTAVEDHLSDDDPPARLLICGDGVIPS